MCVTKLSVSLGLGVRPPFGPVPVGCEEGSTEDRLRYRRKSVHGEPRERSGEEDPDARSCLLPSLVSRRAGELLGRYSDGTTASGLFLCYDGQ